MEQVDAGDGIEIAELMGDVRDAVALEINRALSCAFARVNSASLIPSARAPERQAADSTAASDVPSVAVIDTV
jgi:hypothetical protein